jgi:hypothetical protein
VSAVCVLSSIVRRRYQAATSEDTAEWEDFVFAVVIYGVCRLVKVLYLCVATRYKPQQIKLSILPPCLAINAWQYITLPDWVKFTGKRTKRPLRAPTSEELPNCSVSL